MSVQNASVRAKETLFRLLVIQDLTILKGAIQYFILPDVLHQRGA